MEKINKIKNYLLIIAITISSFIVKIKADSGFDSSFDSGGGGSDYSSSSSDYSSSSSSSSSGEGSPEMAFAFISFFILTFILALMNKAKSSVRLLFGVIYFLFQLGIGITLFGFAFLFYDFSLMFILGWVIIILIIGNKGNKRINNNTYYFNENEFSKYNTKELQEKLYGIYKDIQVAWSKNNIEPVRNVLTDELFNTYQFQIDSMITTNQRNEMSDFNFVNMSIKSMSVVNNKEELKVYMEVTCKDYMVQMKDGNEKVVRGNSSVINDYLYEMTFVRNIVNTLKYCPNCGSELNNGMSARCNHCGGIIVHETDEYVLSKKQMIRQGRR